jgi:hypothetical protein
MNEQEPRMESEPKLAKEQADILARYSLGILEIMSSRIDELKDEDVPKLYINKLEKAYSIIAEVNDSARKQKEN